VALRSAARSLSVMPAESSTACAPRGWNDHVALYNAVSVINMLLGASSLLGAARVALNSSHTLNRGAALEFQQRAGRDCFYGEDQ
jgi:hypothetical protein